MQDYENRLYIGDCKDVLKNIPDNSIDSIVTDPPYGYSFMGKDWDKVVVKVENWKECLRVLKPGAFAFIMSAPRQDVLSRMIVNLQEAGFETGFTSIYWTYASGFPKAANVSKLIDKKLGVEREVKSVSDNSRPNSDRGNGLAHGEYGKWHITKASSKEAKALDGSYTGFQPKPAVEVIIVAMKPLSEKGYVDQAMKNGKGVTWLDNCRIPHNEPVKLTEREHRESKTWEEGSGFDNEYNNIASANPKGRFPANLLVSDDVLNDGIISKGSRYIIPNEAKSIFGNKMGENRAIGHKQADSGSFSRYFDLDKWAEERLPKQVKEVYPFLIVPKASKSEKNKGLNEIEEKQVNDGRTIPPNNPFQRGASFRKNTHPTVKPIKLMAYLVTLGSKEGDIVLDPFCGTATTCIAAKILNRKFIGIDMEKEHIEIASLRLKAWDQQDIKIVEETKKPIEMKEQKREIKEIKINSSGIGLERYFI